VGDVRCWSEKRDRSTKGLFVRYSRFARLGSDNASTVTARAGRPAVLFKTAFRDRASGRLKAASVLGDLVALHLFLHCTVDLLVCRRRATTGWRDCSRATPYHPRCGMDRQVSSKVFMVSLSMVPAAYIYIFDGAMDRLKGIAFELELSRHYKSPISLTALEVFPSSYSSQFCRPHMVIPPRSI